MSGSIGALTSFARPHTTIAIGMGIALIMAFNAWFVIWPNQQIALDLVPAESDEKARAGRKSAMVSRLNLALSIPMLYWMVAHQNGGL